MDSVLCGTGVAHDVDGDQTTVFGGDGLGYEIPFIAGVGPLLIGPTGAPSIAWLSGTGAHFDPTDPDPEDAIHAPVSGDYTGLGVMQITPDVLAGSRN